MSFKKIAIVGVGFMGGSLALSLKQKFPRVCICGYARSKKSYAKLKRLHIVDRVERDLQKTISNSDLVVLALPIYAIIDYFRRISPFLKKGAVVCDLGSSKEFIERRAILLPGYVHFVGCHPLCGSEKSGAEFSHDKLYQNAICLITSSPQKKATRLVASMWKALDSKVIFISAALHDKVLSAVSHLPHLISFSLREALPHKYVRFVPQSLRDLTRISHSPAEIWTDIFLSNKKNILRDLHRFTKVLKKFEYLLKKDNKSKILDALKAISQKQTLLSC